MVRMQSPGFPNMSLSKAIYRVRLIHDKDRRNPIDREVAAKHMGFSSLSGASDKALGSLAHYGLLEKAGKGQTRVSDLAVDILLPDSPDAYKKALWQAAYSPAVFSEIRTRFADGLPSPEALKSWLIRENFVDSAINPVITAYLETCRFLEQEGAVESGGPSSEDDGESGENPTQENAMSQTASELLDRPASSFKPPAARHGMLQEVFNLDEGPVTLSFPAKMSAASYGDLEAHLQIFLRKAKRRADAIKQFNADSGDPDSDVLG
jgi:hypothetical protein